MVRSQVSSKLYLHVIFATNILNIDYGMINLLEGWMKKIILVVFVLMLCVFQIQAEERVDEDLKNDAIENIEKVFYERRSKVQEETVSDYSASMLDGNMNRMPFYLSYSSGIWEIKYVEMDNSDGSLKPKETKLNSKNTGRRNLSTAFTTTASNSTVSNRKKQVSCYIYDGYLENNKGEFLIFSDEKSLSQSFIDDLYLFFKEADSIVFYFVNDNSVNYTYSMGTEEIAATVNFIETVNKQLGV